LNLNVYDPKAVQTVGRSTVRARTADELADRIAGGVHAALDRPLRARGLVVADRGVGWPDLSGLPLAPLALGTVGGVVAAVGTVFLVQGLTPVFAYNAAVDAYADAPASEQRALADAARDAQAAYDDDYGSLRLFGGAAGALVGTAVVVGAVVWGVSTE
jgi:hypothetical protein